MLAFSTEVLSPAEPGHNRSSSLSATVADIAERKGRISPFGWDWGGGRIAMRARNVPGGLVADYSERA